MTYDPPLANRVRRALANVPDASERRMFGGLCFLLSGRMLCGVVGRDLVVRVGPDGYPAALRRPHARPMDFTGRPLRGFVYVGPGGHRNNRALTAWIRRAMEYVQALPTQRRRSPRRRSKSRSPTQRRG
jgi:TfoX/Sxy family transcriptional regulator of competence genes